MSAAINGMLSSEPADVEYNARYIAERAKEITDYAIALEDEIEPTPEEELYYGVPSERVPASEFVEEPLAEDPPTEEEQRQSCFHCNVEEVLATTQADFTPASDGADLQSVWKGSQDD